MGLILEAHRVLMGSCCIWCPVNFSCWGDHGRHCGGKVEYTSIMNQNGCLQKMKPPKLINHFKLVKRARGFKFQDCKLLNTPWKAQNAPWWTIYNHLFFSSTYAPPCQCNPQFTQMARCHSRAQRFCSARQWRCLNGILLISFIFCLY